ncbi:tetratricopeptide repeat protein [Roseofilum sp. BLCC_M91]|uniref:Tetratricopeptide repeat protein n=1 Tax=Roseofilum halophilum BLCC-M91 TaxID=3022259 RepID=A0ABT7BEX0_9CYAN|nr:tetratricopeptide repeat protein [Roseofilum halophilum]MDJ1177734.1 tetratricopeptide repeat protein [Roseofilum halophilum BLCC-M91]
MWKRFWRSLIQWIQGLWGKLFGHQGESVSLKNKEEERQPPLDRAGYEFVFMQLLEGVSRGWQGPQVQEYLSRLSDRTTPEGWLNWLTEFGDRLLENPLPNHQLASRMLKLGEIELGMIGQKSTQVGRSLLQKTFTPETLQPMTTEAQELFYQGNALYEKKQYNQALSLWDQALAVKPDFYQVWTNRGVALNQLKRYEEALGSYDQALAIKSDYDMAWSNRGVALRNLGRYQEALDSYEQALKLQPNAFDPWLNRGTVLSGFDRFEEALQSFQKATEIRPEAFQGWVGQARILTDLQRYEEAIAAWDEVIARKEMLADAWQKKALSLYALERYEETITCCERALQLEPEHLETISYWSKAQARLSGLAAQEQENQNPEQPLESEPESEPEGNSSESSGANTDD